MTERRPLGDILIESGRITQEDVAHTLEYQRAHGGFFGQGLVALGVVTREEIDWALASQFDLPFVFPNASAVDSDVAHLVPADWALAHLAVPILRVGETIRVVVADPLHEEVVDDLRKRTGCDVEVALASADRIRQLIHRVYSDSSTYRRVARGRIDVSALISRALDSGAERFGVSVRGGAATGWWQARDGTHRAPLVDGWEAALAEAISPPFGERIAATSHGVVEWDATLGRDGRALRLQARALIGRGGAELLFVPLQKPVPAVAAGDLMLPAGIIAELQLLWGGGSATVGVFSPDDRARALLPFLPTFALGESVRTAHITSAADEAAPPGVLTLAPSGDEFVADVAAHRLDALTVDLASNEFPAAELTRAAPMVFVLVDVAEPSAAAGLGWLLTVSGEPGAFAWDLRALHR
jgi:hypothetical protein